jgi:hypothetical protein
MAFLTIAGLTVPIQAGSFSEKTPAYRGESVRAFDHTLLSGQDGRKRQWAGTTVPIAPADAEALRDAVKNGAHVACTGAALRGLTYTCEVTIESAAFDLGIPDGAGGWTSHSEALTLTLVEV